MTNPAPASAPTALHVQRIVPIVGVLRDLPMSSGEPGQRFSEWYRTQFMSPTEFGTDYSRTLPTEKVVAALETIPADRGEDAALFEHAEQRLRVALERTAADDGVQSYDQVTLGDAMAELMAEVDAYTEPFEDDYFKQPVFDLLNILFSYLDQPGSNITRSMSMWAVSVHQRIITDEGIDLAAAAKEDMHLGSSFGVLTWAQLDAAEDGLADFIRSVARRADALLPSASTNPPEWRIGLD